MISKTFTNLKKERQEEILDICYQEFALKGYDSASLSEIIKRCGLAKGSFYRYFSSKKELYIFLLEDATQKRLSNLHKLVENPEIDFFELIKYNFLEKVQFDLDFPVIGGFLYKVMHEKDNNEISDVINHLYQTILERIMELLKIPRFSEQLITTNHDMMAFQIFHMQLWLYDYIAHFFKVNFEKNIKNKEAVLSIGKDKLEQVISESVQMLKNGIGK